MTRSNGLLAALSLALLCAGCGPTLDVAPPTLVSGTAMSEGKRIPAASFHLDDRVVMLVDVSWADPTIDAGIHDCEWRWYRDGRLVSDTHPMRLYFRSTPYTLRTARAAATLGLGQYTVQTLIDDKVVATSPFSIVG